MAVFNLDILSLLTGLSDFSKGFKNPKLTGASGLPNDPYDVPKPHTFWDKLISGFGEMAKPKPRSSLYDLFSASTPDAQNNLIKMIMMFESLNRRR